MKFPDRPQTAREWARFVYAYGEQLMRARISSHSHPYSIEVEPAKQALGIDRRVEVTWVPFGHDDLNGSFGSVWPSRFVRPHRIFLVNTLHPVFASMVCWHELTHAAQSERLGAQTFIDLYNEEMEQKHKPPNDYKGYASVSFEREAYLNMNNHFKLPLTQAHESYKLPA